MTTMEVLAQIDGIVSEVICNVGDHVNEGDEVLVLESMKMEIGVMAPASGKVTQIGVVSGDVVTNKQLLVMLETA